MALDTVSRQAVRQQLVIFQLTLMSSVDLQAVTEHHVLVLFPHKLVALNTVSRQAAQQLPLTGRSAIGNPLGLAADAITGTVYLYTGVRLCKYVFGLTQ